MIQKLLSDLDLGDRLTSDPTSEAIQAEVLPEGLDVF